VTMVDDTEKSRLEILLPPEQRARLDALSIETGFPRGALARVGINWLLAHSDILLKGPAPADQSRDAAA